MSRETILNSMTKKELIYFIKQSFACPSEKELAIYRWHIKSKEIKEKRNRNFNNIKNLDFSKRKKLIEKFNTSVDIHEKEKVSIELKKFSDIYKDWKEVEDILSKSYEDHKELYKSILEKYNKGYNYGRLQKM